MGSAKPPPIGPSCKDCGVSEYDCISDFRDGLCRRCRHTFAHGVLKDDSWALGVVSLLLAVALVAWGLL